MEGMKCCEGLQFHMNKASVVFSHCVVSLCSVFFLFELCEKEGKKDVQRRRCSLRSQRRTCDCLL